MNTRRIFYVVSSFSVQVQKRKAAPEIHSLLAGHTRSVDQPRLLSSQPTKIVSSRASNPTIHSSTDQMESRFDVTKGQRRGEVLWIPEENLPSSCALSSDQLQSQFRHSWCPIKEVGHDQPRLPAFHVFKQVLPGRWSSVIRLSGSSSS